MAMVSMKADDSMSESMSNEYGYGYGLELHLNDDQCEALGIKKPIAAGSILMVKALGYVKSVTESVEDDRDDKGNDVCMCIQLTDMELSGTSKKPASETLYGS